MNNKSTENLIGSDGSVEELSIPSLDLKVSNRKNSQATTTFSDRTTDDERKIEQESNHGRDEKKLPPVPAARKSILPPIASKRSDKEVKNNQNQLRKEESIEMPIIERRKCFEDKKPSPNSHRTDSGSEIRTIPSKNEAKSETIALVTLTNETRNQAKKRFADLKGNEETTSFISQEEKHEKEDVSEHLSSSDSIIQQSRVSSTANLLDVDHIDKEIEPKKDSARSNESKTIIKTKIKKSKRKKDKQEKKEKRGKSAKEVTSPKDKMDKGPNIESYDFKYVIGIWLHETSALRFDPLIRMPRIRVSVYNIAEGSFLMKSNPLRNAVLNYEPTNVTFIQPILSNQCKFKDKSWIECDWSNELLIINEDIHHIEKENVVIFFEILDILPDSRSNSNGWYSICWAFLRPGDGKTFSNLNNRCSLQLYFYQRHRTKGNILEEWKTTKRRYPASLSVTVGPYKPELQQSISISRPMSVLEEEITGDIYTRSSDDDDNERTELIHDTSAELNEVKQSKSMGSNSNRNDFKAMNLESRLPGQECECPNRMMYRFEVQNSKENQGNRVQYGSMVSKFSPSGFLLAFHCTTYRRQNHEVVILNVNNLKIRNTLIGHLNIVYDLDWLNEKVLCSVSSDRTAIVWFLSENEFSLKILPHPSFIYTVKWLPTSLNYAYIATGGRDCNLRIWQMTCDSIEDDIELYAELIHHEDYLTSFTANKKSSRIYTADWAGILLEWARKRSKTENNGAHSFLFRRKIKVFPTSILRIEMHPKNNRLHVQCLSDPLIYIIEPTSAVVMQTIETPQNKRSTFTISPCGSFVLANDTSDKEIKWIRISDTEDSTHIRLPISLTTRRHSITSLSYHPTKDLVACTLFGNSIGYCMYLMYRDRGIPHRNPTSMQHEDRMGSAIRSFEEWDGMTSPFEATAYGNTSNTFDAILHRIDNLFCLAIQSPKHFKEFEELKQMQIDLNQLQKPLNEFIKEGSGAMANENLSKSSGHSKDNQENIETDLTDKMRMLKNIEDNDSRSTSSKHTFTLDGNPNPIEFLNKKTEIEATDKSDQTYSIKSDQSNLTFEIQK